MTAQPRHLFFICPSPDGWVVVGDMAGLAPGLPSDREVELTFAGMRQAYPGCVLAERISRPAEPVQAAPRSLKGAA